MIKFVLGRSGCGKTEYCFSQIEELVNNGEENILLITPEQYNFTAEKKLLRALGEANINKVSNSSFSRLNTEASRKYGGNALPVLSKGGKAVLMKKAIDAVKDRLTVFDNKTNSPSFVISMVKIYDEMSSCDISPADMLAASNTVEKEILSRKLFDMSVIISEYSRLLRGNYYDSADELSRLYDKIAGTDFFKGRSVFIDGFYGFDANEFKILELIIKDAKNVTVTFSTDSFDSSDQFDLFAHINKNARKLQRIAEKYNEKVSFDDKRKRNYRTNNEALLFCEKNLYSRSAQAFKGNTDSISLYSAKSISDECAYIALQIKKELRAGRRAREIAVICRDSELYANELIYAFRKYEVPYYVDERQPINTQPLIVFVQYLLRAVIYSFRSDDILSLAKTGLTELERDKISNLENYIYVWSISGVKKWSDPFTSSTKGFTAEMSPTDAKRLEEVNTSRRYLIDKIIRFKSSVKNETAREIGRAIYDILHSFGVNRKLKVIAESLSEYGRDILAEEQGRVWDILMDILNQLAVISGDEKISLKDYLSLFNIMAANEDLGVLPQGLDNVQFGQADRIRADNPKSVYILGANEGEFPRALPSGGLLSESDRIILSKNNMELYSFGETLNLQERYFAYTATSAASEKLCVTYLGNCANPTPSAIVNSIKKCYPNIKEIKYTDIPEIELVESNASAFELMAERFNDNTEFSASLKEYFKNDDRFSAVRLLSENDEISIKNPESATKLFGKQMYLSASRVEDFFNCRFKYFCKFGLMARPRERAEMNPMKTGTVIHYVLENIIKEIGSAELGKADEGKIKLLVDKYLRQYLDTEMGSNDYTSRFTYQYLRISKMLYSVVSRLAGEFSQCRFEAKAFELNIDIDGEVKPKPIPLENGGSVLLRGEVDRVDVLEENGNKYVRVIDYKSGTKKFRLSDILHGLNLQMFVYLFTLCSDEASEYHGIPAGVLYMHAARSVFALVRGEDGKKIFDKEKDEYKMKGLVLYDDEHDILSAMEKDLEGKFIPASYDSKKGIKGDFATLADLGRISKRIEKLIAEMGNLLQSGKINQNPINGKSHDKTCEVCDYAFVCANRRSVNCREIEDLKNEEVLEILKEE